MTFYNSPTSERTVTRIPNEEGTIVWRRSYERVFKGMEVVAPRFSARLKHFQHLVNNGEKILDAMRSLRTSFWQPRSVVAGSPTMVVPMIFDPVELEYRMIAGVSPSPYGIAFGNPNQCCFEDAVIDARATDNQEGSYHSAMILERAPEGVLKENRAEGFVVAHFCPLDGEKDESTSITLKVSGDKDSVAMGPVLRITVSP